MSDKEDLALFLGMLSGDGHLSLHHKKRKSGIYYDYYTGFCNTNKEIMVLFGDLFFKIFGVKGHFYPRDRMNRKRIYEFHSYSREVFDKISSFGFPVGVKRDRLKIPKFILTGSNREKEFFTIGLLITDGSVKKGGSILFHSGSKLLLEDLSVLFEDLFGVKRRVKEYLQRGKFFSYQLSLNKQESQKLLMPPAHNGRAPVLRTGPLRRPGSTPGGGV